MKHRKKARKKERKGKKTQQREKQRMKRNDTKNETKRKATTARKSTTNEPVSKVKWTKGRENKTNKKRTKES